MPREKTAGARRYAPWRRVVEFRLRPVSAPGSLGETLGGQAHVPHDVLECGHAPTRRLLVPDSKKVHITVDGQEYRRCLECPRVTREEAGP